MSHNLDTNEFCGREWLFDIILGFLNSSTNSKRSRKQMLAVTGSSGSGKTRLCHEIEQPTKTVHMSIEKSLVNKRCLSVIYLDEKSATTATSSRNLTHFRTELTRILIDNFANDYSLTSNDDLDTCLDRLNDHPTNVHEHHSFLLVDNFHALGSRYARDVTKLIVQRLPIWIKLVVTSDNEWMRANRIELAGEISLDSASSSRPDLNEFFRFHLADSRPDDNIKHLVKKSACNFRFANHAVHLIKQGLVKPDEFRRIRQPGLSGLYSLLLGKLDQLSTRRLARLILALIVLNTDMSRNIDSLYVVKRLPVDLRADSMLIEETIDLVSRLFFFSFRDFGLCDWLASRVDLNSAIRAETYFYWRRLCRFEPFRAIKTSTPCIPLVDIEFIDRSSSYDVIADDDMLVQIDSNYSFYLNQFRRFFTMLITSTNRDLNAIQTDMDLIFERYFGSASRACGEQRFGDDDHWLNETNDSSFWDDEQPDDVDLDSRFVCVDEKSGVSSFSSTRKKTSRFRSCWKFIKSFFFCCSCCCC